MKKTIIIPTILLLALACGQQPKVNETPGSVLAQMRADTSWIHELDSLAQIALGPGAKCLDPVWHTFSFDERNWLFNQDWGGVLEIPSDYNPRDDLWQAGLSFHGTSAWSPDSLILVSFYAGIQALTEEESNMADLESLKKDGFAVQSWDKKGNVLTVRARSAEGINYYSRQIFAGEDGIEYSVSVQYPDEKEAEAVEVIKMADRYPAGPSESS